MNTLVQLTDKGMEHQKYMLAYCKVCEGLVELSEIFGEEAINPLMEKINAYADAYETQEGMFNKKPLRWIDMFEPEDCKSMRVNPLDKVDNIFDIINTMEVDNK